MAKRSSKAVAVEVGVKVVGSVAAVDALWTVVCASSPLVPLYPASPLAKPEAAVEAKGVLAVVVGRGVALVAAGAEPPSTAISSITRC